MAIYPRWARGVSCHWFPHAISNAHGFICKCLLAPPIYKSHRLRIEQYANSLLHVFGSLPSSHAYIEEAMRRSPQISL